MVVSSIMNLLEKIEKHMDILNRERKVRWIVRWTYNDKNYAEGYEFHMLAIRKQLILQEVGIESIIECAR